MEIDGLIHLHHESPSISVDFTIRDPMVHPACSRASRRFKTCQRQNKVTGLHRGYSIIVAIVNPPMIILQNPVYPVDSIVPLQSSSNRG